MISLTPASLVLVLAEVALSQVSHHIYSLTDLMATDSLGGGHGGHLYTVTVTPPPGFLASRSGSSGPFVTSRSTSGGPFVTSRPASAGPLVTPRPALVSSGSAHHRVFLPTPLPSRLAAKSPQQKSSKVVKSKKSKDPPSFLNDIQASDRKSSKDGSYSFSYSTSNGMSRTEAGAVGPGGGYAVTGSYQFRGTDGATYRVTFTADQRGYRPRISKISEPSAQQQLQQQQRQSLEPRKRIPRQLLLERIKKVPTIKKLRRRKRVKRRLSQ